MAHPEDFCQECGLPNPTWYAPNLLWNKLCKPVEIICPICFQKRADKAGINLVFTTEVLSEGKNFDTSDGALNLADVSGSLPLEAENSWPTKDVLTKLIWATEYLLHEKDYDGHNWEELEICANRGKEILSALVGNDR
jgi:hypothetical protein